MGFMRFGGMLLAAVLVMTACADRTEVESTEGALRVEARANAVAYDFTQRTNLIHGISGDSRLVFVSEAMAGRVIVLDRFTGAEVAQVAPPPGGWILPFTLRVPREGRLVVMDTGGFPSPTAPVVPRVYDVDYQYDALRGGFRSNIARTVRFDGLPTGYSEDLEVTRSGDYILTDSILGSIWVIRPNGTIVPAIVPALSGISVPILAPCAFPGVTIDGIRFTTAGDFAPGVGSVGADDTHLYFATTCNGGIHRIPLSTLTSPRLSMTQRARAIETVSPRAPGAVETLKGLTFNHFDPSDRALYAVDSIQRRVFRMNTRTGAREILARDPRLFDFPVAAQFLPPVAGQTVLVVSSDQEYRLAALNPSITTDMFSGPFVIAKVHVFR